MATGYKIEDLTANAGTEVREPSKPVVHTERCPRCDGSGAYRAPSSYGHRCFKCQGRGTLTFKKSKGERAAARQQAQARKQAKRKSNVEQFKEAKPLLWQHMEANAGASFFASLMEAVAKYGELTARQESAVLNSIERKRNAALEAAARVEAAPVVSLENISAAFDRAAKRLKYPRLSIATYVFTHAGANSKNPGALYVKREGVYLGKIMHGKFLGAKSTTQAEVEQILKIAADPKAAAVEHGRLTGNCAICNRQLTNEESVKFGIGPICSATFFGP